MYKFEELDDITRKWMLEEFLNEEKSGAQYRSSRLSERGLEIFPIEMKKAIVDGNEESLEKALENPDYWNQSETYRVKGGIRSRAINPTFAAQSLARTEFITWFTRGFARRLIEEGEKQCQVVRIAPADEPRGECLSHENGIYDVLDIYNGHRARYCPPPGKPNAFSIPMGTNCHHSIRRSPKSQ
jgi:hypothetical protein